MAQARSVIYVDAGGNGTVHLIRTSVGAGTILNVLLGHSNADFQEFWEGTSNLNSSPSPTNAQYPSGNQIAQMQYLCADNTIALLRIPAPKLGIFLGDQVTVDPATVADLTAVCVGNLLSASSSPAVSFLGGRITPVR